MPSNYLTNPDIVSFPSASHDAFGRVRVSNPVTLFDFNAEYDTGSLLFETTTVGSGSETHVANESTVDLDVTTASGDKVTRQTRSYHRYQPGKSQFILMTFVMGAGKTGCSQRVGYFDDNNGVFFEKQGTQVRWVKRSYVTGAAVDTGSWQGKWSIDTCSDLNFDKSHIAFIDLEWLGVGIVRVGFVVDGVFRYCHEFKNANVNATVYMTTANLPVRYEIENTAAAASATKLKAICCSVMSEGGFEESRGYGFSASNGGTLIGVTTRRPIFSIRPKATFNSVVNRGQISLKGMTVYVENNSSFIELVYDGSLTSASFASVNASSIVEKDVAASAITGGIVIWSGYVAANASAESPFSLEISARYPMVLDAAGANPKNLTVVATSMNLTSDAGASLSWSEIR